MNKKLIGCLLASFSFMVGCKNPKDTPVETVPEVVKPRTQYVEITNDTAPVFSTFCGNINCEVQGMNINGMVRIERDNIIWASANKIVELGRVKITPDSILAYVKVTNQYVRTTFDDLRKQMNIDLDFATLQSVLIGQGSNKRQLLVEYDDFDSIENQEFAKRMDITINDRRYYTTIQLKYHSISLNLPQSYPFYISKTATSLLSSSIKQ